MHIIQIYMCMILLAWVEEFYNRVYYMDVICIMS